MLWEAVTQILTPILMLGLTMYLGRRMKRGDELRLQARQADQEHRARIEVMLAIIQRQNGWISRKLVEMIAIHNIQHPTARIEMNDYPDSD